MKISKKQMGILTVAAVYFFLQCSGGGDEVLTAVIPSSAVGYLYCYDGKIADHALIKAIPVDSLPQSIPVTYYSHTNLKGRFTFSSLPKGEYNLFCVQDSLRAMIEQVKIEGAVSLHNDTLKLPGSIEGTVLLSGGEDCRSVLIMITSGGEGLISAPSDTSGAFILDSLAEGSYSLRFISTYRSYSVLDTIINVLSGKSTDIGTIIMKGNQ